MLVIDRELILPTDCLLVGASAAGVTLPGGLLPDPVWRSPAELRTHEDGLRRQLADLGVWRDGRPTEAFSHTVTVLGRAAVEVSAMVESTAVGPYYVHVAVSNRDAVLACRVPATDQVVLRPSRPEAPAEDLVAELPEGTPAVGPSLSVPESDLRRAIDGAPARRDVRRVLEVAGLPRVGGGQISAGVRDGLGRHRTTGDSCCTFYDTEQGRYVFSFTEQPGYERYVNVAPGHASTLIAKTYDLLEQLRLSIR